MGDTFFLSQFESPQIEWDQFEYLVRCSLIQLCGGLDRGCNTVSPSAWSHWTGLAKVGVTGDHCITALCHLHL